jgi:threonine/homoserine/homoserine lactone efflux protein
MLSGHLVATLIVAAGMGSMLAGMPVVMTLLTAGGSLYLLWIGMNLLIAQAAPISSAPADSGSPMRWYFKGFCVSGLNPKVFLLFLALLPQFSDPRSSWPVPVQLICLGLIHIMSCAAVYFSVGFGAREVLSARPEAANVISRLSGAAMVIAAVFLIAEHFA